MGRGDATSIRWRAYPAGHTYLSEFMQGLGARQIVQ